MFERITTTVKTALGFGRSVLSERDGTGSASRSIGLIVTIGSIGVLVAHVWMHHSLPAPEQLYGLSALIAAGSGAYATNKIRRDSRGDDTPASTPGDVPGGTQ